MTSPNTLRLFEFMRLVGKLKRVQRTGWVQRNVKDPESVADHMYRMALLSFLVEPQSSINKEKCIKISLVHDLAECIVGDITPADGISREEKHKKEMTAMTHMCSLVPACVGQELFQLWEEYENQGSDEAKFVKDLDQFEMILQAHEYEQLDKGPGNLQEFFDSTQGKFKTDQVKQWATDLLKARHQASGT